MKAVSFYHSLPITAPESLVDIILEQPCPGPRDLLVQVKAISVNPVDTKVRAGGGPRNASDSKRLLGWDAAGIVVGIGSDVSLFHVGDEVFYAGEIDRSGTYAEFHVVDDRIVGRKPASIGFAEAAALPLTTITAWEMLFDRLKLRRETSGRTGTGGSLLIVGAAGGVGSIATQLARQLTPLTVIASASRPETQNWCLKMGAHHVVDHSKPLANEVRAIAPGGVDYVLAMTRTDDHLDELVDLMAPQSALALIENVGKSFDVNKLKPKCISLHWEFMFTRARYRTPDMADQGRLLNELSALIDGGLVRSTLSNHLGTICAENLKRAHALVESGKTIGKIVLEGF